MSEEKNKKESKKEKKERAELEDVRKKSEDHLRGWQRAQADYANLKKEHAEQLARIKELSVMQFVEELLPVIDHYEMAINHVPKEVADESWMQGFYHIKKQFDGFLAGVGVLRIKCVGEQFDPHLHEAIESVASDEPEGIIVKEAQPGYRIGEAILRHARVIVSKGKA